MADDTDKVIDPLEAFKQRALASPDGNANLQTGDNKDVDPKGDDTGNKDKTKVSEDKADEKPTDSKDVQDTNDKGDKKPRKKPTKDESMADLRRQAEERLKESQELQKQIEQLNKQIEDAKPILDRKDALSPILSTIDEEFDGEPEKFLTASQTRAKKLKEAEELISKQNQRMEEIDFQKSDWYIQNVQEPYEDAQSTMLAAVEGDQALFTQVWKIASEHEGPLSATDKSKIGKLVKDHELGEHMDPKMVWSSASDLKRIVKKSQDLAQSREEKIKEIQTQRHEEAVRKDAEHLKMRITLMRDQSDKASKSIEADVKTKLGELIDDKTLKESREKPREFMEGIMTGSADLDFTDTSSRLYKAALYDALFEDKGLIDTLLEKAKKFDELDREGAPADGQDTGDTGDGKDGMSKLDKLRKQHLNDNSRDNSGVVQALAGAA